MKKKHIIGLSILLLVLLLGLSTTCYADSTRIWTDIEIKNVLYNLYVNVYGANEQTTITNIENNESKILQYVNDINTRECIIIKSTSGQCFFVVCNSDSDPYLTRSNSIAFNKKDSNCYYLLCNNSGLFLDKRTNLNDLDSWSYNDAFYYTSLNIRNFRNAGTYNPSTFFNEWYWTSALPFSFVSETGLGIVTYNNYEYTLFEKPSSGDLLLGQLYIPNGIIVNYQDVLNFYWRWNNWQVREFSSDSIRLQFVSNNNGDLTFNVYLNNQDIYINTYYLYTWSDHTSEPYQFTDGGCYIKDSHTVIVNGVVDPFLTFSGDYADEYNNELENMDLQQNLQDQTDQLLDSSEVDGLLAGFSSSGDILNAFGYSPIENPFVVVISNVFQGLNDVLLGSGNQTLDLSSFGLQLVLHSEDFVLPNNIITTFIHLICNGFFVYGLYKYGFQLIQWINTGRLQNLLDETSGSTNYLF